MMRLKKDLFGVKNLLAMFGIFVILFFLVYGYFYTSENIIYAVGVLDHDESDLSKDIVRGLKANEQIRLSLFESQETAKASLKSGSIDVLYEINEDFEKHLKAGNKDRLMKIHKESTMKITAWLNDLVSIRVLKTWAYYDIFNRINNTDNLNLSETDYESLYNEGYVDNQLIDLKIEGIKEDVEIKSTLKVVFALVSGVLILLMTLFYGKNILHDRKNNIIRRLFVSGYSKALYYRTKVLILILFLLMPIMVAYTSFIFLGLFLMGNGLKNFFLLLSFMMITFIIFMLLGFWLDDEGQYLLVGQTYILLSILFSLQGVSDMFKIVSFVKWLFPLQYLVEYFT